MKRDTRTAYRARAAATEGGMMPHDMFAAIIRVLARHGMSDAEASNTAHEIMDEFEGWME